MLAAVTVAGTLLLGPAGAGAQTSAPVDPALQQTIPDLQIVHGNRVLETGHVDMGPKFESNGTWRFLIHDDVARADANATSVWRYPAETVFHILDAAQLTVPSDPAYSFIGANPGSTVWVVPQTQNPGVVWVGWNTQDPTVMKTINRGITLSLAGVQGPGTVTVYLQSGSFGKPQLLWDSRKADAQPIWVDVNTHTHANWVFTQPGIYLLRMTADADLLDGSHVSDTQYIRFAVGTSTSTDQALATTWQQSSGQPSASSTPQASTSAVAGATQGPGAAPASSPLVPILIGAIVVVAVALVVGFTIAIVRGNQAKRRILAARATQASGPDRPDPDTPDPGIPGPDADSRGDEAR